MIESNDLILGLGFIGLILIGLVIFDEVQITIAKNEFCYKEGFEKYQNRSCVKFTEEGNFKSKAVVCISYAAIKFKPAICGWKINDS